MARSLVLVVTLALLVGCDGTGGTPRTYPLYQTGGYPPSHTRVQSQSRSVVRDQTNCPSNPSDSGILVHGDFSQAPEPVRLLQRRDPSRYPCSSLGGHRAHVRLRWADRLVTGKESLLLR
jgi:hypothetical protein